MVSYDGLFRICAQYTAQNFYVGDVIPPPKLVNARKRYPIPQQERVVALLDTTVFGSAKTGLAVGETGLHWRNASIETERTYLSWRDLSTVPIVAKGVVSARVEIGREAVVELSGSAMVKDEVVRLLSDIQHSIRAPSAVSEPAAPSGADGPWTLAVEGQQFGPYDLSTVAAMVAEGRIAPGECWAWKEGMPNWERFTHVPVLASLLSDASRPAAMPPPLPASTSPSSEAPRFWEPSQDATGSAAHARAVSYDDLLRVCAKYIGDGYYVGEAIPEKKLANARSSFSIPDSERIVALFDMTVFGSAKDGLAVCTGGVYWHNMFADPKRLLWAEFASVGIEPKGSSNLQIGGADPLQSGIAMKQDDALKLLSEIQALVGTSNGARRTAGGETSQRARQGAGAIPSHQPAGRGDLAELPRPDLNQAPVDDLLSLPVMSLPNGQKLVRERERRGGFGTIEEAGHFLGLQPHQVERLKRRATLGPYEGIRPRGGRVVDF